MCKHPGHIESPVVVGGELDFEVLAVRRRVGSHVDDDIEDGATRAADQLGFGRGCDLIMHPAEGAFVFVVGDIDLDGIRVQTDSSHFTRAECACEEAPVIGALFHFDNHRSGQ